MKHTIPYAEDYTCIIDSCKDKGGLFIGNLEAAENINNLQKNQIKAILTAARGVKLSHKRQQIPYYLHIHADDHEQFQISKYFNQAANFIRDALQKTNVMVHCLAGVSRSVSLVIAYLIKYCGKSFDQAYELIKKKRRVAHPNHGFVKQLKKYELQNQHKSQLQNQFSTMPLAELKIGNQIKIIPQKIISTSRQSQAKQNKIKSQRVPGRIKRFNSVVQQPQLANIQSAEMKCLSNYCYEKQYKLSLREKCLEEANFNRSQKQGGYKNTIFRSYLS